jgi:hypothetical protein
MIKKYEEFSGSDDITNADIDDTIKDVSKDKEELEKSVEALDDIMDTVDEVEQDLINDIELYGK